MEAFFVMKDVVQLDPTPCSLELTKHARVGIEQWFLNEKALFSMQDSYVVYIEKRPANRQGNMSFSMFFDPASNSPLAKELKDRVAVLDCVIKNDGFVAVNFRVRGGREPIKTNRRHGVRIKFHINRSGIPMPIELYTTLRELPIAEERSEYVKKRISSWEGYLRIAEKNADVEDLQATFSEASLNEDFTKVRFVCNGLNAKNIQQLQGFSVKLVEQSMEIGQVINVNKRQRMVEVELNQRAKQFARNRSWLRSSNRQLIFSNFAQLSQVRRLRKGFKDLQDGLAANPNLEKILFEERPVVQITNKQPSLEFHNQLNDYQREAVIGAMRANDLYVIQGPPGTGKTTVISEICYQNVKAGLRTLVASQSNLAVDNALGRLLSDPAIRILRYGRTESIEEEGKKFIEENVALNWRDETLEAVVESKEGHVAAQTELSEAIEQLEHQKIEAHAQKQSLEERMEQQRKARIKYEETKNEIGRLESSLQDVQKTIAEQRTTVQEVRQTASHLREEIQQLTAWLENEQITAEETEEMAAAAEELTQLRLRADYFELQQSIQQSEQLVTDLKQQAAKLSREQAAFAELAAKLRPVTKFAAFKECIQTSGVEMPIAVNLQMNELSRLIRMIETKQYSYEFTEWNELHERLMKAIFQLERLLTGYKVSLQSIPVRSTLKYQTIEEIHGMIDRIARFLIEPETKRLLDSSGRAGVLSKLAQSLSLLYGKLEAVKQKGLRIKKAQVEHAKQLYAAVKRDALTCLHDMEVQSGEMQNKIQKQLKEAAATQSPLHASLQKLKEQADPPIRTDETFEEVERELHEKETFVKKYEEKKEAWGQQHRRLGTLIEQSAAVNEELARETKTLETSEAEERKMLAELEEQKRHLKELETIVREDFSSDLETVRKHLKEIDVELEARKQEQSRLPDVLALQNEWQSMLAAATDYDLDEIRKMYVEHANVIGTTCVASAGKTFVEEYPTFDVVIIDEVSKATPPELLLPMLKGKKIILVGDHHQLPPLIGQETLDELLEENMAADEQKELKTLLNESLFERLFRTLPKQNKTMLSIQYRMHEQIMQTITPFYKEGSYELQCGLDDSDAMRDHLLETPLFGRDDHLLWFDLPNEPSFFEERVKGGTSRFNESELAIIRNLLQDLEQAAVQAKAEGRMEQTEKKRVGIISFYGEQVKRIDRLIEQELQPKQLHCRTGSVDKFQGMEMDVIILSFVRNHAEPSGDIGFAKDYRRLNVALSRAKELLLIVGSSEMFTVQTKHASSKKMYGQLYELVKQMNGIRSVEESHLIR